MEAMITGLLIILLTATFVLWCIYISNKRLVKTILATNGLIFFLYITVAVISGDEHCSSEWLCFQWQHYAFMMIIVHATLFECFMLLHLLAEKVVKWKQGKNAA